jgi:hypothetical protein
MNFISTVEWQKRQREAPLRALTTDIHAMVYSSLVNRKEDARPSYGYLPAMLRGYGFIFPKTE